MLGEGEHLLRGLVGVVEHGAWAPPELAFECVQFRELVVIVVGFDQLILRRCRVGRLVFYVRFRGVRFFEPDKIVAVNLFALLHLVLRRCRACDLRRGLGLCLFCGGHVSLVLHADAALVTRQLLLRVRVAVDGLLDLLVDVLNLYLDILILCLVFFEGLLVAALVPLAFLRLGRQVRQASSVSEVELLILVFIL